MICRNCDGTSFTQLFVVGQCTLGTCTQCQLVQVIEFPENIQIEAIYGERYFAHTKYFNNIGAKKEQKFRLELVHHVAPPKGALLDVGCATGDFVGGYTGGLEATGFDLSNYAIQVARERFPNNTFFSGSLADLKLTEEFDVIVLWDVIEHLDEPERVLQDVSRMLKRGGHLIISTPNYGSLTARLMGKRWAFMTPPEHLIFFTKKTLLEMLQKFNFECLNWCTKGKWTTLGFIAYKLNRVFPNKLMSFVNRLFNLPLLTNIPLYAPTSDIQYMTLVKK